MQMTDWPIVFQGEETKGDIGDSATAGQEHE